MNLFADDTCLLFSADSVAGLQIIANKEISKREHCITSNKLTLNHNKTKFIIISKKQQKCSNEHLHKESSNRSSSLNRLLRHYNRLKSKLDKSNKKIGI